MNSDPMTVEEKRIPISEIFGPVIQGEGTLAGHQTYFIRTGGCDYRCSWCDTPYAVLPSEVKANCKMMTVPEILNALIKKIPVDANTDNEPVTVTISGGNPAIHDLSHLIADLHTSGCRVALETQGTVLPEWIESCDIVTISPKPPSSKMVTNWAKLDKFIERVSHSKTIQQVVIKVVVAESDEQDYEYARGVFYRYRPMPKGPITFPAPHLAYYVQPMTLQFHQQLQNALISITAVSDRQTGSVSEKDRVRTNLCNSYAWLCTRICSDPDFPNFVRVVPQLHSLAYGLARGV